jgi:hypothetical protein
MPPQLGAALRAFQSATSDEQRFASLLVLAKLGAADSPTVAAMVGAPLSRSLAPSLHRHSLKDQLLALHLTLITWARTRVKHLLRSLTRAQKQLWPTQTDVHGQSHASPTQHTACVTIHHHSRSPMNTPLVANAAIAGAPRDWHSIHPPAADVVCSCWCPTTRIQVGGARSAGEHGGVTRGRAEPRCARARRPSP